VNECMYVHLVVILLSEVADLEPKEDHCVLGLDAV
jgi:hypothetical protein